MTITAPRLRDWLPRLVTGQPHQVIGGHDDPYLLRWYVIPRNPVFNVYLHKFLRSDDDRALHDHPWWFVSLILRGRYDEITDQGARRRNAGSLAFRPAEWRHRVQAGVVDHITKELREILDAPDDLSEWADVIILALDGAQRTGADPQAIIDAIVAKQAKNEARDWPDWRTQDPTKAIEHQRAES